MDNAKYPCRGCIPWYMRDARFEPGTVADVGDVRLTIGRTERKKNNKWRLYMGIRTRKKNGVDDDLKRDVCVAEFRGDLTLGEVQEKVSDYFLDFISGIVYDLRG